MLINQIWSEMWTSSFENSFHFKTLYWFLYIWTQYNTIKLLIFCRVQIGAAAVVAALLRSHLLHFLLLTSEPHTSEKNRRIPFFFWQASSVLMLCSWTTSPPPLRNFSNLLRFGFLTPLLEARAAAAVAIAAGTRLNWVPVCLARRSSCASGRGLSSERFISVYPNTDTIMNWSELGVVALYYNLTA